MYIAKDTFAAVTPHGLRVVRVGMRLPADDERVKGHEQHYDEIVEQTSAKPRKPRAAK